MARNRGERHLIQATAAERMAAQKPPQRQGRSAPGSVYGDGYRGIFRACWLKTASPRAQRVHGRRKPAAIQVQDGEQNASHHAGPTMAGREPLRAASALACVRIRTISASSFV